MTKTFPYQNRNYCFAASFIPSTTSTGFSIGLDCEGLSAPTIEFVGSGGFLKTSLGEVVGSYNIYERVNISGNLYDESASLFINGVLTHCRLSTPNQGSDGIFADGSIESVTYEIGGSLQSPDKKLIYITDDAESENGLIQVFSGMGLWSDVVVAESEYSGQPSAQQYLELNNAGLVVIGVNNDDRRFIGATGWAAVEAPVMFIDPMLASQDYAKMISGRIICTDENNAFALDVGNEVFDRTNFGGAGDMVTMFDTQGMDGDVFHYETCQNVYLTGIYNKVLFSSIESGHNVFSGWPIQSGERYFLSTTKTGLYSEICDSLTDEWKKLAVSAVRALFT